MENNIKIITEKVDTNSILKEKKSDIKEEMYRLCKKHGFSIDDVEGYKKCLEKLSDEYYELDDKIVEKEEKINLLQNMYGGMPSGCNELLLKAKNNGDKKKDLIYKRINRNLEEGKLLIEKRDEISNEYHYINRYLRKYLPVKLAKKRLNLSNRELKKYNKKDILRTAILLHQEELIKNTDRTLKIKHVIDGLKIECHIKYNSNTCMCGIPGYIWENPEDILYSNDYLFDDIEPLIQLKSVPILNIVQEFDIMDKYKKETIDFEKIYGECINYYDNIHSKNMKERIEVYKNYYVYGKNISIKEVKNWRKYIIENCGEYFNHCQMVIDIHIKINVELLRNMQNIKCICDKDHGENRNEWVFGESKCRAGTKVCWDVEDIDFRREMTLNKNRPPLGFLSPA